MGSSIRTFVCGLLAASACAAPAHADSSHLLPESHDAEHERIADVAAAEQARLAALSSAERRALQRRQARVLSAADAIDPAIGGAWGEPFDHRSYGMHSALLPTGKVLFWSLPLGEFGKQENEGLAWLWDPSKGTGSQAFKNVDPPLVDADGDGDQERAPLYCSGQSFLPDGRLLVAGGNLRWPGENENFVGWNAVFTFDPVEETWQREEDMAHGRWYPSQVLMADGRTAIVAGYDETGATPDRDNPDLEFFTPGTGGGAGDVIGQEFGSTTTGLYPHLFVVPGGDVLMGGPNRGDTALLKPEVDSGGTGAFWDYNFKRGNGDPGADVNAAFHRTGGTGVLLPGDPSGSTRIMQIGGWGGDGAKPTSEGPATATTELLDAAQQRPVWTFGRPLTVGRSYHNTVLLPDGTMVTVGGGSGKDASLGARANYADGRARQVELWNPATQTWTLGAAQAEKRGYHSVALLLPDGRVLSSGDDIHGDPAQSVDIGSDTIELYSPPYLFKGERPVIAGAPDAVGYDAAFSVMSDGADLERAVLMAPSATTHGADMTQRHVELQVTSTVPGSGINVRSPKDATLAPPGWYMLFLIDGEGVPSVARWVRLGGDAGGGALLSTLAATPLTAARTTGEAHTVTLTLRDANGVPLAGVPVRSTVAGANPTAAAPVTTGDGTATVGWTGTVAGRDTLSAYADLDGDSARDPNEPVATASVDWTAPQQPPSQPPPDTDPPKPPVIVEPPIETDGIAPTVKLRVTRSALRSLRSRGRLTFRLSSDETGRATLELRPKGRKVVLARATRTAKAGTRTVTLTLSAFRRRQLRRVKTVELRAAVKDGAGNTGRKTLRAKIPAN